MPAEPLNDLIDRALRRNPEAPAAGDVLQLYLNLPRVVLVPNIDYPGVWPHKVRSSFEAVFADSTATSAAGVTWLASAGFLIFFDQVGTALRCTDVEPKAATALERALELFSDVDATSRAAIYALRCALVHDFSLVNPGRGRREGELRHAFVLHQDPEASLVELPPDSWGPDWHTVTETGVGLDRLAAVAQQVRDNVMSLYESNRVELALDPAEARRRYIFVHPVDPQEWNEQEAGEQEARRAS